MPLNNNTTIQYCAHPSLPFIPIAYAHMRAVMALPAINLDMCASGLSHFGVGI